MSTSKAALLSETSESSRLYHTSLKGRAALLGWWRCRNPDGHQMMKSHVRAEILRNGNLGDCTAARAVRFGAAAYFACHSECPIRPTKGSLLAAGRRL